MAELLLSFRCHVVTSVLSHCLFSPSSSDDFRTTCSLMSMILTAGEPFDPLCAKLFGSELKTFKFQPRDGEGGEKYLLAFVFGFFFLLCLSRMLISFLNDTNTIHLGERTGVGRYIAGRSWSTCSLPSSAPCCLFFWNSGSNPRNTKSRLSHNWVSDYRA